MMSHQKDKIFKCGSCEYQCFNMRQLEAHLDSGHRYKNNNNISFIFDPLKNSITT